MFSELILTQFFNTFMKVLLYLILIFYPLEIFSSSVLTIEGKITSKSGQELIGANVVVLENSSGVATGIDGNYRLTILENAFKNKILTLKISYIGYQSLTDTLNLDDVNQDLINMDYSLAADVMELESVVVTGVGIQQETRGVLRPDGAPAKAVLHQKRARVHDFSHLRHQEGPDHA